MTNTTVRAISSERKDLIVLKIARCVAVAATAQRALGCQTVTPRPKLIGHTKHSIKPCIAMLTWIDENLVQQARVVVVQQLHGLHQQLDVEVDLVIGTRGVV